MDQTPKMQKRVSLSLKRLNGSAQNIAHLGPDTPRSPSVTSISSESNFHTPPHRKLNWDENTDYSPKLFDTSFSPSALLSQSLAIESPEVGWRWTEETPDSAYTDSSYTSAASSSVESKVVRTRGDMQRQRLALLKREEQRKVKEIELRRAEKVRTDEMLKMRCAKFQEHLKSTGTQSNNTDSKQKPKTILTDKRELNANKILTRSGQVSHNLIQNQTKPNLELNDEKRNSNVLIDSAINDNSSPLMTNNQFQTPTRQKTRANNNTFNDFLNDSDSDCLLLEATQELESKIVELTQKAPANEAIPIKQPSVATPTSSSKEKRSSFYMQFFEDDSAEDWFDSLDEVIKEATQAKKPRTSLQRYNSMPTTTSTSSSDSVRKPTTTTTTSTRTGGTSNMTKTTRIENVTNTKMKRHASSHSFSPGSSSYRRNDLHLRK